MNKLSIIFVWQYCLLPISAPVFVTKTIRTKYTFRLLLVFGFRVAAWTVIIE